MGFFEIQAFEQTAYFHFLKFTEYCLFFVCFIYIDPEQLYGINNLKGSLFLYARLCVTEKSPKFATYSERHNCLTCWTTIPPN